MKYYVNLSSIFMPSYAAQPWQVLHTIDHNILLNRLKHYLGISGIALAWFKSYLSDHYQFVEVN